jgi:hypothetical protein
LSKRSRRWTGRRQPAAVACRSDANVSHFTDQFVLEKRRQAKILIQLVVYTGSM